MGNRKRGEGKNREKGNTTTSSTPTTSTQATQGKLIGVKTSHVNAREGISRGGPQPQGSARARTKEREREKEGAGEEPRDAKREKGEYKSDKRLTEYAHRTWVSSTTMSSGEPNNRRRQGSQTQIFVKTLIRETIAFKEEPKDAIDNVKKQDSRQRRYPD